MEHFAQRIPEDVESDHRHQDEQDGKEGLSVAGCGPISGENEMRKTR